MASPLAMASPKAKPPCRPLALLAALGLGLGSAATGLIGAAPQASAQTPIPSSPRPYARPAARPTVSVPDFKNTVTQPAWWWQGPVAADLAAALANELQATGDLQVVERNNLKAVLSEQELAELGIVRKGPDAARRGQMRGARYIVLGTVTSYDTGVESKTSGSNFGLLGFGTSKQQAETRDYVAIDIRVVDSSTGEVIGSRTVEGRASNSAEARSSGVNLLPAAGLALWLAPNMGRTGQGITAAAGTLNFGNNSSQAQRTPAAKAIRAALIDASGYVSCLLAPKAGCMAAYEAQEQQRRERTRGVLQLE
ncbi:CsgG/HfaB family protein [Vulcanococcus limneticus]|uniref:CsgG/HfaB family protein n=1 Tax=Vulcanococcus limneticus TaxID=2170428 RepID=UPI000B97DEFB|nr:CsgG/HfaB family protein [Vulcanococcus limneticus]MCP9791199.1 penicillin-binding protein activator LpoB [Vulcanococcus limneticus MW73D5]MCP9893521.1 penicillin-binding protein activator LpoB [Vulcanococcus limneticus Candia 3F8]MCP9896597.1 penicillin-binding protein activator LpoB [Vulcanococcus limneticus Candia 3B3]